MFVRTLSKSFFLLTIFVVIVCGIYPFVLWLVGQIFFPFQANGSIIYENEKAIGSKLIAQAFTQDEYFQPRPSAAAYNASASASSALAASNYALRNRVARMLGPIAKDKDGKLIGSEVEKWFQQNKFQGNSNIVAQWATLHNSLAQAWVNADSAHSAYVDSWIKTHPAVVKQFEKENPSVPAPKAVDLAVMFFQNFSREQPGKFPVEVVNDKKVNIVPKNSGTEIQSIFFDMWRQDNPDVVLQTIPGDYVTTSASGLDPDISLQNAEYQLDRVVAKWASVLKRDPKDVRSEIEQIIQEKAAAPLAGLAGEKFVNVLELNLELRKRFIVMPAKA